MLIPGAGGAAISWHRVAALLRAGDREADAVDLPGDDDSADLSRYAALVDRAIAGRPDTILVAQSLGGFTAATVAARRPIGHLVPHVKAEMNDHAQGESPAVFGSACDFAAWPDIPITVIAGAEDRFFPIAFQRRVARERLGLGVVALPGGHLIALSHPGPLAAALLAL